MNELDRQKDLNFLSGLEQRLHFTAPHALNVPPGREPITVRTDHYNDSFLTTEEMEQVFGIVERQELALYPMNTRMGFAVGFEVADPSSRKALLTFEEKQLPAGYDFNRMAQYFMRPENVARAAALHQTVISRRSHYEY